MSERRLKSADPVITYTPEGAFLPDGRTHARSMGTAHDHQWAEIRGAVARGHVKQICRRCGLETFEDARRLSMAIPCVERALAPDQVEELEGRAPWQRKALKKKKRRPIATRREIGVAVLIALAIIGYVIFVATR